MSQPSHPIILDLASRPATDPMLVLAERALARQRAGLPADTLLAELATHGVVAILVNKRLVEIRERLDGWTLADAAGMPDLATLAGAARVRATRLAALRARQSDTTF
ncbi:hypothetical protein [Frankia sp. KB5]|uniref:hypothetical protein n=1 Tax=Frankia sp. KB5 TaxID=683318 RepID=UPI000A11A266|nr:hypothetical protein [Frankia sp. KB5]ORT53010.1 hypothetical protein KBI5_08895 [Frankia sp. KB5]